MLEELEKYIKENMIVEPKESVFTNFLGSFKRSKYLNEEPLVEEDYSQAKSISINEFVNQKENYSDFQTLLFKFIDDRKLKDSDVYNKVHIDRRLFSKIRSDKDYHPSKETIILLGLSLELSEKEIEELLESASYTLPKNNYFDLIIRFCFINKIFKLTDVNDLLSEYDCKLFNY